MEKLHYVLLHSLWAHMNLISGLYYEYEKKEHYFLYFKSI